MSRSKILRHATSTRPRALVAGHERQSDAKGQKGNGAGRDTGGPAPKGNKGKGKGKGKDRGKGKQK